MAESQLTCMEDGHIGANVPENKPEFLLQRSATICHRGAAEEWRRSLQNATQRGQNHRFPVREGGEAAAKHLQNVRFESGGK
ncbi:hypothetical protein KUCAC02_014965 [Chaenocephalus aceratus]|nr:hypothetical protein KUCAC02_014965 [Chaenocephalus aceratus]